MTVVLMMAGIRIPAAYAQGRATEPPPSAAIEFEKAKSDATTLIGRALGCGFDLTSVRLYRDQSRRDLLALAPDAAARSELELALLTAQMVGMNLAKAVAQGRSTALAPALCDSTRAHLIGALRRFATVPPAPAAGNAADTGHPTDAMVRRMLALSVDIVSTTATAPVRARALAERAALLLGAGEAQVALADASQVIDITPDEPNGYALRGGARTELGEASPAVDDLTKALALGGAPAPIWLYRGRAYRQLDAPYLALRDHGRGLLADAASPLLQQEEWRSRALAAPAARIALRADDARVIEGSRVPWLMVAADSWLGGSAEQMQRLIDGGAQPVALLEVIRDQARRREALAMHLGDLKQQAQRPGGARYVPTSVEVLVLDTQLQMLPEFMGEVVGGSDGVLASIGRQLFLEIVRSTYPELERASITSDSRLFVTGGQPSRRIELRADHPSGLSVRYAFQLVALPPDQGLLFVLRAATGVFDARLEDFERMLQTVAIKAAAGS
jgi:tetratricopeptide (TPR) repeat protein